MKKLLQELPEDRRPTGVGPATLEGRESVAQHLRKSTHIAEPARWNGLLLERGYYAPDGTYVCRGLVDNLSQRRLLDDLLRAHAQSAGKELFPASGPTRWQLDSLDVEPLAPMLAALRRVLPADPQFDGIKLESAYHDVDKRLVFRGLAVGTQPIRLESLLKKKLLDEGRDGWKRRAAHGVSLAKLDGRTNRPDVADLALVQATALLRDGFAAWREALGITSPVCGPCAPAPVRRDGSPADPEKLGQAATLIAQATALFDTSLLHVANESLPWYLRAVCAAALGDDAAAERDLRRVVDLERGSRSQYAQRLLAIEWFQGSLRQALLRQETTLRLDDTSLRPPLRLSP